MESGRSRPTKAQNHYRRAIFTIVYLGISLGDFLASYSSGTRSFSRFENYEWSLVRVIRAKWKRKHWEVGIKGKAGNNRIRIKATLLTVLLSTAVLRAFFS